MSMNRDQRDIKFQQIEEKKQKQLDKRADKMRSSRRSKFDFSNVLTLFLLILLIGAFVAFFKGEEPRSFYSLLEFMGRQSTGVFDGVRDWLLTGFSEIAGDWGFFDFLREFFNLFASFFNVLFFLIAGILNSLDFIQNFIAWLFGIAI